jgi:hypothetical protein
MHRDGVQRPVAEEAPAIGAGDADALSSALRDGIRDLRPGGSLLVRMTQDGVLVGRPGHDAESTDNERV